MLLKTIALVIALMLAGPAVAGPFEDAASAYNRGDYAAALRLLRPLAERGNADAQFNLGFMYDLGKGVPRSEVEAARLYRLAAEQGLVDAQWHLGFMYANGQGVPQDYVLAHMWLNLAAAQNMAFAAGGRDRVAVDMTPDQIAEAQRLAREWRPTRGVR